MQSRYAGLLAQRKQIDAEILAATRGLDRELLARYVPGRNQHERGMNIRMLAEEYGVSHAIIQRRLRREEAKITKALRQLEQTGKPDDILRDIWICYELGEPDVTVKLR